MLKRRVTVAEGNHRDVHIGSLLNCLGIDTRIGDNQQTRLLELLGDLVGEGSRGEASSDGGGASVLGELQNRTLTVRARRDNYDVLRVFNSNDDTGSHDDFLPCLAKVHQVKAVGSALPNVVLHFEV